MPNVMGAKKILKVTIATGRTSIYIWLACHSVNAHRMILMDDQSKKAQPLLLLLSWGFSLGLWRQFTPHGSSLEFPLRLCLVLAENHGHGIDGLDAVHLHKVPPLSNVVNVSVPVLGSLASLVLFMHEDDVLPLGEEVGGLLPQVRYRGHEILEGRVVGVVHEEGVHSHGQQRALRGQENVSQRPHGNTASHE